MAEVPVLLNELDALLIVAVACIFVFVLVLNIYIRAIRAKEEYLKRLEEQDWPLVNPFEKDKTDGR